MHYYRGNESEEGKGERRDRAGQGMMRPGEDGVWC